VWSLSQQAWSPRRRIDFRVGTLLGCQGRALGVYGHPRLIDPATATVLAQWPEVATSSKDASYSPQPTPIVAVHPDGTQAAVATTGAVAVLDLPSSTDHR
jgi:hypothetical protein